ncbi:MAG: hypothetical protein IIV16_03090 [Alistipes sp.]|nr:hypothetical protein [Alistipes sp.]
MKRFTILAIALLSLIASCAPDGPKANVNDLQLVSGIRDRKLILEGSEGYETTFSFHAKHDWAIIDYKGFSCDPSTGSKCAEGENVVVSAKPLKSNNTADTIFLSDLNFKLLSTRFVGIVAYQLPQIRLPKGNTVYVGALNESANTIDIVSSSDDISLVTEGDITATLGEKRDGNKYTINIKATAGNNSAVNQKIGTIGFEIGGVRQESKIEVIQISAIVLDRSEIILPSKAGGQNIFEVESNFEVEVSHFSEEFTLSRNGNTFTVTAMRDNDGTGISSLGAIEVALKDNPECKRTIEVKQRNGKAPQTLIVHFIGTSLKHYFDQDIKEIIEALNSNIQGNAQVVIIATDTQNKATLYEARYDHNLGKAVQEKVKSLELPTPYDSELFERNLREALEFAPAEKYALIIGSHGLAWVPKIESYSTVLRLSKMGIRPSNLWLRNKNAKMTRHLGDSPDLTRYDIDEVAAAIEANNVKFDYILFDACFMSNVESLYELRNTAKYIIASPCEVMGYGFPYARIMKYMLAENGTSYNLDKICSEYANYYKTDATTRSGCVALTKTAELEALAQAMKAVNTAGVKSDFSLDKVQYFEGQSPHSFYDLGHMVELSCADATAATQFKTQLDKTVTSRYHTDRFYSAYGSNNVYYHDINYYSGITTSAMVEHYAYDWQQTEWYKATH